MVFDFLFPVAVQALNVFPQIIPKTREHLTLFSRVIHRASEIRIQIRQDSFNFGIICSAVHRSFIAVHFHLIFVICPNETTAASVGLIRCKGKLSIQSKAGATKRTNNTNHDTLLPTTPPPLTTFSPNNVSANRHLAHLGPAQSSSSRHPLPPAIADIVIDQE